MIIYTFHYKYYTMYLRIGNDFKSDNNKIYSLECEFALQLTVEFNKNQSR